MGERRLVGYCTRCGGDCFDDGTNNYHRCPPKRAEAEAVVALKFAADTFRMVVERRSWAGIVRKEDCGDLLKAFEQYNEALRRAYP